MPAPRYLELAVLRHHWLLYVCVLWSLACGGGTEPEPVASVSVTGGTALLVGTTLQLTANALSSSGAQIPSRKVTWVSQNPSVATVAQSGLVTGVAEGSARIDATAGSVSGSIGLQVSFPYPNVSGSYAYAALFDGISSADANGIGVIAIAQGDRTKPDIQMAPLVNWIVGTTSFNFTSAYAATINGNGSIAFRMGAPSATTTWNHSGNRTTTGGWIGRHTLAGTSSTSGNWGMARSSGVQALMQDRGLVPVPRATVDDVRRMLELLRQRP